MKKSTTPSALRDQCLNHFKILGVVIPSHDFDAALQRAEKEALSHLRFLDLFLGQQAAARRERSVERRIRDAHFKERQTLEAFDWKFNPQIDRVQIEELATGDFIGRRSNLILVGQAGVGKSHIVQALGMRACTLGHRVLYRTSAKLLSELTASLADKTLAQRLRDYNRPDLLIIDEFGFDHIERLESPQAAHLLYKVIVERHQRRSTALITNIDFDAWASYLTDGPLAMAFLDRLVEGSIIIKIKGKSYRAARAAKQETVSASNTLTQPTSTRTS